MGATKMMQDPAAPPADASGGASSMPVAQRPPRGGHVSLCQPSHEHRSGRPDQAQAYGILLRLLVCPHLHLENMFVVVVVDTRWPWQPGYPTTAG